MKWNNVVWGCKIPGIPGVEFYFACAKSHTLWVLYNQLKNDSADLKHFRAWNCHLFSLTYTARFFHLFMIDMLSVQICKYLKIGSPYLATFFFENTASCVKVSIRLLNWFTSKSEKILEQVSRTRFFTEFEIPTLLFCAT